MTNRPGDRFLTLASWLVDRATVGRLVVPAIADMQHEHATACRDGNRRGQRLARAKGYWSLVRLTPAIVLGCAERVADGFWRQDEALVRRLLLATLAAVAVLSAILVAPPLAELRSAARPLIPTPRMLLYLLPQALALALPAGILVGALIALRREGRPGRAALVRLFLVAATFSVLTAAAAVWLTPLSNQLFRNDVARRLAARDGRPFEGDLMKGPAEMTPAEIASRIDLLQYRPGYEAEIAHLRFVQHFRVALSLSPAALLVLAIGVASVGGKRWWPIGMTIGAVPAVETLWRMGIPESMPAFQAWLPAITYIGVGASLLVVSRTRLRRVASH